MIFHQKSTVFLTSHCEIRLLRIVWFMIIYIGELQLSALVNNLTPGTAVKVALQLGFYNIVDFYWPASKRVSTSRETTQHSPRAEPVGPHAGRSGAGCALRRWGGHSRGGGACRSGADGSHGTRRGRRRAGTCDGSEGSDAGLWPLSVSVCFTHQLKYKRKEHLIKLRL